jgi:hypothetical protein
MEVRGKHGKQIKSAIPKTYTAASNAMRVHITYRIRQKCKGTMRQVFSKSLIRADAVFIFRMDGPNASSMSSDVVGVIWKHSIN